MVRVAVVLGAGGAVGHGYHAGVLAALAERGWDARSADVLVGTSAGSIVASLLRAGLPAADLARRAAGRPLSAEGAAVVERASLVPPGSRARPPLRGRGRLGSMASPTRLARAVRAPWHVTMGSLAAAALPEGQVSTDGLGAPFTALYGSTWPVAPLRVVAVALDSGRRVVFGRPSDDAARRPAADASVAEAVRASCAIPGYFEPVTIDGERYVDGGVHSTTNADVVVRERTELKPELVVVSAPMSAGRQALAPAADLPLRQFARLALMREIASLRRRGVPVVAFQPSADDLDVMRGDALDPAKIAPVAQRVTETTLRSLDRPEVASRLTCLFES